MKKYSILAILLQSTLDLLPLLVLCVYNARVEHQIYLQFVACYLSILLLFDADINNF